MSTPITSSGTPPQVEERSPGRRILIEAWRQRELKIGLAILVVILIGAVLYPLITDADAYAMDVMNRYVPPLGMDGSSLANPFGTDQLGRDVLARSFIGLGYSLLIAVPTVILMYGIGCVIGILAGVRGGLVDTVAMRLTDAQLAIPMILLAVTVLGVARPNVYLIITVLALAGWPLYARVARSAAQSEKRREYIRAARVLGASEWRIIVTCIAPAVLPPIAFVAVLDIARIMILESILGFLGLGIQPPTPSFGNMIADGRKYLVNHWWVPTMPGILLLVVLISINMVGASLERARNRVFKGAL
ncbi:ABC transporter permease [Aquisalimonas asiatica]|uniref:Peptide/nickel transport system permease protein n=1 Tax=Aquisalimonas asiatica TaxID=406100 RepID=A0A1H8PZP9_9GAMM|nr:ABC transporter permease [Aquisalimonas asiatica]SEO47144.1 peptide/nickel transport system permease protein [Aquisalimonas asiatica]